MRRRLVLGATYLLLVVVIGLVVPFGVSLGRRLTEELGGRVEREAFAVGAAIEDLLESAAHEELQPVVERMAQRIGGRVIVTDAEGTLLADSLRAPGTAPPSYAGRPEVRRALQGYPNRAVRSSRSLGYDILVSAVPIGSSDRVLGAVRISYPMKGVRSAIRRSFLFLGLIGLTTLITGMLLAAWLARWIARPLRQAAVTARRIAAGDLDARVPEGGPPEVSELARDLNTMTDRLADLLRANREFAANASHQLRTPLTALRLRLEEALDGPDPRAEAAHALRQAERLERVVESLLALGESRVHATESVDVGEVAEAVASEVAEPGPVPEIWGAGLAMADPERLRQVLTNLTDNARRSARRRVRIDVEEGANDRVVIRVDDDGPGVPPEDRERIFDRFYRGTRAEGRGSGLGLAVARELARADGAELRLTTGELGGACFELSYPSAGRRMRSRLPNATS